MQVARISEQTGAAAADLNPSPRLVQAAHEFEGQMLKELLKPVTECGGLAGDESDSFMGSGGVLGEFAGEALGQALSQRGGFGIADRIITQRSHSGPDGRWRDSNPIPAQRLRNEKF